MLRTSGPIEMGHIIDLPSEERTIKIPIQGYMDALGITPISPQTALINAVNDPQYRFIVACLSRRVGKTFVSNILGQLVLLYPGTKVLIVAPDYTLASISWDLQQELIKKFDLETSKNNAKDRSVVLENGSEVRVASVSRIDSAVGRSYDLIIFDEAALNNDGGQAFNVALMPTLDKVGSKAIFISTPRGDNWFKEFFDRGFDDEFPEWFSIHCDYTANPRADEKAIEGARKTLSTAEFAQEYLADFVVFEGQIWGLPEEKIQDLTLFKRDVLANPERYDIIGGIDIGFRDETAMCVIVVIEGDPDAVREVEVTEGDITITIEEPDYDARKTLFFIVDEYYVKGVTTSVIAENIKELEDKWDIDFNFIDSAAAQMRFDLAQIYDISTINATKDKLPGIAYVAGIAENGTLVVDERCEQVVYSMNNYRWDQNSQVEKPLHDRASHMADAIRYALYTYSIGMGGGL